MAVRYVNFELGKGAKAPIKSILVMQVGICTSVEIATFLRERPWMYIQTLRSICLHTCMQE